MIPAKGSELEKRAQAAAAANVAANAWVESVSLPVDGDDEGAEPEGEEGQPPK